MEKSHLSHQDRNQDTHQTKKSPQHQEPGFASLKIDPDEQETAMGENPRHPVENAVKKKRKRRPPAVPWKKPKDMPRRPLSAYNIFFKEQREAMMAQVTAAEKAAGIVNTGKPAKKRSNKSVGIGFANLARTIGASWKELGDATRSPYEAQAGTEKERYQKEMLVWRAKQKEIKDKAKAATVTGEAPASAALEEAAFTKDQAERSFSGEEALATIRTMSTRAALPSPSDEAMQIDSPKKSRHSHNHNNAQSEDSSFGANFTPSQPSADAAHSDGWSNLGPHAIEHNHQPMHSSMSRLDALHATQMMSDHQQQQQQLMMAHPFGFGANMGGMHGMMPAFSPNASDSAAMAFGAYSTNNNYASRAQLLQQEEQRLMMQQQHLLQQQHQMMQQQQMNHNDPAARRSTWSGGGINRNAPTGNNRYQAMRRATNERENNNNRSQGINDPGDYFPESWFESEEPAPMTLSRTSNRRYHSAPPTGEHKDESRGAKVYPDNWFEVGDETQQSAAEDRDLTGKLPSSSRHKSNSAGQTDRGLVKHSHSGGEGKMDENDRPLAPRSLGEMAAEGAGVFQSDRGGRDQEQQEQPDNAPFVGESSSLQALGMQFDDETMDFFTRLRYDAANGSSDNRDNIE